MCTIIKIIVKEKRKKYDWGLKRKIITGIHRNYGMLMLMNICERLKLQ